MKMTITEILKAIFRYSGRNQKDDILTCMVFYTRKNSYPCSNYFRKHRTPPYHDLTAEQRRQHKIHNADDVRDTGIDCNCLLPDNDRKRCPAHSLSHGPHESIVQDNIGDKATDHGNHCPEGTSVIAHKRNKACAKYL